MTTFLTCQPGRLSYRRALELQEELLRQRALLASDILVLLEHDPVVTLGRRARPEHLLWPPEKLAARGIEIAEVTRGGDITYHGPGQLVGYPIVDLDQRGRDLHLFLRQLEEMLIQVLSSYGVRGRRRAGKTGVWVGDAKIASLGIGVRRWISWHGFALNIGADLSHFSAIVPCGLAGVEMTSLEVQLGRTVARDEVAERTIRAFADVFQTDHAGAYEGTIPQEARLA